MKTKLHLKSSLSRIYRFSLAICLFFSFSTSTRAQYEHLLYQDKLELDKHLTYFWNDRYRKLGTDTTIHLPVFRAIQQVAAKNNDRQLQTYHYLFELRILERANVSNKYYQEKLDEYLDLARGIGDTGMEAAIEYRLAEFYLFKVKNYEQAFRHFNKMRYLSKNLSINEYPSKLFDMEGLLYLYRNFKEYENSIDVAKELMKHKKSMVIHNWNFESICLYSIGKSFDALGRKDSSLYYLEKAVKVSRAKEDTFEIALSEGFLGQFYFNNNDYKSAVIHLEKSAKYHRILNEDKNANKDIDSENLTLVYLVAALNKTNQSVKAQELLEQLQKRPQFDTWQTHRPTFYNLLSRYHLSTGESVKALAYADTSDYWSKKNEQDFNARKALRVQQKLEIERIETENTVTIFRRNIILGLLILMFVISLAVYLTRIQKKEKELLKAKEELERSKLELDRFSESFKNKLSNSDEKVQDIDAQKTLQILEESTILTKDEWEDFKVHFNKVYPSFFAGLLTKYPNLTQGEIRFLSLKKLGFSNMEMANTLGVSDQSIRTTLYRLRKNIDLSSENDISKILENI